ncbi:hypothetical protein FNV43_RR20525 [Rhamnella rubrinervis]|uniref:ABC transporter domain-containing protein n=1 Tax=Rhamnella rubrinervis TaxID=2594499 RepID=A0A8K0GTG7_9ROSA|nr:hypothetical protein FNV43_RR20525 [Rhamnella rubrinervis]
MVDPGLDHASFWTQADALLRKNLTFQKRNKKSNIQLIFFPLVFCSLIAGIQYGVDKASMMFHDSPEPCDPTSDNGSSCPVPEVPESPPLLQIPLPDYRAVKTDLISFTDLPNESCRRTKSCPAAILITGNNKSIGEVLAGNMFTSVPELSNGTGLAINVLGTSFEPRYTVSSYTISYYVQCQCTSINIDATEKDPSCVEGLCLWRNSSSMINYELYEGYQAGSSRKMINEFVAAYDFLNSDRNTFNVNIWYNATYKDAADKFLRVPRSLNLVSNSYLHFLRGRGTQMIFEFFKDMPRIETLNSLDIGSLIGSLFFVWIVLLLFPVILTSLVYEKQQRLRIMMKMHGLGDGPYWLIYYVYFLCISSMYMLFVIIFGSVVGLSIFKLNAYSIQFVFYFMYLNLQISFGFLVAAFFSNVKTASVVGYIYVFGTGFLGFVFKSFLQDSSFPRGWIIVMELYPGFSLFRGLYEFIEYADSDGGMRWDHYFFSENGMKEVLVLMFLEWFFVLYVALVVDHVVSSGSGVRSSLFFFLNSQKKSVVSTQSLNLIRKESKPLSPMEKADIIQEREKVEHLLQEPNQNYAIICNNLRKVYPPRDESPSKVAVRGLFLALPQGECFGMLGPNGAGKTSFISMMIGLTKPTDGTAFVHGLDIRTSMNGIYMNMGPTLGNLNRKRTLTILWQNQEPQRSCINTIDESLKSLNLFDGGTADKQAWQYSGGMKRRLSVAISLIGDPKVVYMDEPSTGLDPASRNSLWKVVKRAKQDRAIILTTHSMEEADILCDRLGFFVDGSLQCIGNPKELKARYGGSYVFTISTSSEHEEEVESLVQNLSPNSSKVYQLSGTQKFELPKNGVNIADVFQAVEQAKKSNYRYGEKLDIGALNPPKTFCIADLGCSVGPNTFAAVENIIEAVKSKYQSQSLSSQIPEFQVLFNDHVSNDFNILFTSLPHDKQYYAAGLPGSFYGRSFPEASLHFVHSSTSLHWLSRVPKEVMKKDSLAWNKGRIHYANSGHQVIQAYKAQHECDMGRFLGARAHEIVYGGLMVLSFPFNPNGLHPSQCLSNLSFDLLGSSLMELARKGKVSEEKVDCFNLPIYFMCPKELEAAVERNGCFRIERMESLSRPELVNGNAPTAIQLAAHVRASTEGLIKQQFGDEDIMDVLFDCWRLITKEIVKTKLSGRLTFPISVKQPGDMREGLGIALLKASPLEVVLAPHLPLQLYECL